MNRNKISIASFALASLVALSACSNPVTENADGNVLTIKTSTGGTIDYTADELFGSYRGNETGVSRFVEAITEVVIRNQINQTDPASKALKDEILRKADISVDGVKETARNNAATNNTNYNEELKKLFDSYNVEDLEELKDYFAYQTMKQEVEDRYFKNNKDNFLLGDEYGPGFLTYRAPYHVKHILVRVSANGGDLYNGRISEAEARKIHAIGSRLAIQRNDETFGEIAREMSDDGSKEQFGDLGIMSKATSFVNEFKLGVYAYDAVFNQDPEVVENRDTLNVPEFAQDFFEELDLARIPFHAFESLRDFANVTKNSQGNPVNDNDPLYYPRNILFNQYFNRHQIAVVTPESRGGGEYNYRGFRTVEELGNQKVLTDENGRVILVVRAGTGSGESGYQGIHFIVVERSALIDTINGVSLAEYYTSEIPTSNNYPKFTAEDEENGLGIEGQNKTTFVNFRITTTANYRDRAETVNNEIRNFDRFFNFRMLENLIDTQEVSFVDEDLEAAVLRYLDVTRASAAFDEDLQLRNTWNSFIEFLEYQEFQRQRLINENCAYDYLTNDNGLYNADGGICYVQK
jgi:hypothetical protein